MTDGHDDAAADAPEGLQALALSAIQSLRVVLDLAERAARDPQGAARVVSSLATFAKMAFDQVGQPSDPPASPSNPASDAVDR